MVQRRHGEKLEDITRRWTLWSVYIYIYVCLFNLRHTPPAIERETTSGGRGAVGRFGIELSLALSPECSSGAVLFSVLNLSFERNGKGDIGRRRLQACVVPTHQPNSGRWLHSDTEEPPVPTSGLRRRNPGVGCTQHEEPQVVTATISRDNDTPRASINAGREDRRFSAFSFLNCLSTETSQMDGYSKRDPRHFARSSKRAFSAQPGRTLALTRPSPITV